MLKSLGLRHVALNVKNVAVSKKFYLEVLKMELAWEPDPQNAYLTSGGQDNLALHQSNLESAPSALDHIGFMVPTSEDVDSWYTWVKSQGARIVKEIKTHRDGSRSFYFLDPDDVVIQMIHHPDIK